jgi:hypothetical protein
MGAGVGVDRGSLDPETIANVLNTERRNRRESLADTDVEVPFFDVEPSTSVPAEIMRVVDRRTTNEDRARLERPRIVFSTRL